MTCAHRSPLCAVILNCSVTTRRNEQPHCGWWIPNWHAWDGLSPACWSWPAPSSRTSSTLDRGRIGGADAGHRGKGVGARRPALAAGANCRGHRPTRRPAHYPGNPPAGHQCRGVHSTRRPHRHGIQLRGHRRVRARAALLDTTMPGQASQQRMSPASSSDLNAERDTVRAPTRMSGQGQVSGLAIVRTIAPAHNEAA